MTSPGGRAYGPLRRERRWFWATMPSQTLDDRFHETGSHGTGDSFVDSSLCV